MGVAAQAAASGTPWPAVLLLQPLADKVQLRVVGEQWLGGLLDKAIYAVAVDSPESAAAVGASTQINSTQLKRFGSGSG